jgi:hypothetical protein
MPHDGSTDVVRSRARAEYFEPARHAGRTHVVIQSGEFNKKLLEDKLIPSNRIPLVCNALKSRKLLKENHATLETMEGPPSGTSSTVVFTYRLEPLPDGSAPNSSEPSPAFNRLRGMLQEAYHRLGGAEAFHRKERAEWGE